MDSGRHSTKQMEKFINKQVKKAVNNEKANNFHMNFGMIVVT